MYLYEQRYLQIANREMSIASNYDTFDWVVMFNDNAPEQSIHALCSDATCVSKSQHGAIPYATIRSTEEKLEVSLQRHGEHVSFVEPDMPTFVDPDIPSEGLRIQSESGLWNLERVGVPRARFTGKGIHIYVTDTGVRTTHEDFGGRAISEIDTIVRSGQVTTCSKDDLRCGKDNKGHGTHAAGIAGGRKHGVAKEATLHAIRVCCSWNQQGSHVFAGMDWVATNNIKPAIMTMSLGSEETPEAATISLNAVVASGVTVIVSAGNKGLDSCTKSYTFIPSAIGVGATNEVDSRASYSNWGACNAIYAPGTNILSCSKYSDTESLTKTGTSMAAPLVAGAAALFLEENPAMSPGDVRATLLARATKNVLQNLETGDPNLLLKVA